MLWGLGNKIKDCLILQRLGISNVPLLSSSSVLVLSEVVLFSFLQYQGHRHRLAIYRPRFLKQAFDANAVVWSAAVRVVVADERHKQLEQHNKWSKTSTRQERQRNHKYPHRPLMRGSLTLYLKHSEYAFPFPGDDWWWSLAAHEYFSCRGCWILYS